MRTLSKRLAALLVALAMTLTGLGAAAEAALMPQTPEAVFERGNFIKSEMHVQLDLSALPGLLALAGAGDDPDQGAIMAVINQALTAVNKLKATVISGKDVFSLVVGTELANVMDMQMTMNEGGDSAITSGLLPGFKLTLPQVPEMQRYQVLIQRHKNAFKEMQVEKLLAPYAKAVNTYFTQTVLPTANLIPGKVEIADVGSFDSVATFDVTSGMLAGLISAVVDVLKQDTAVRTLLDTHLKIFESGEGLPQGFVAEAGEDGKTPKDSAELIAKLEEGIAQLQKEPAALLARQSLYTNTSNMAFYATTEDKDATGLFTIAGLPVENGQDLKVSFLVKAESPSYLAPDATATQAPAAPVDWAAIRAGVLQATDFSTLITFDVKSLPNPALNQYNMSFDMKAYVQGIQLGLQAKATSALAAPYASKGEMSFSVMSPNPLLTFFYEDSEVTDAPVMPALDSLKAVELNEEVMKPGSELFLTLQEKGLPALIENLKLALPEEAPILLAFIQQLTSQSTPTPN